MEDEVIAEVINEIDDEKGKSMLLTDQVQSRFKPRKRKKKSPWSKTEESNNDNELILVECFFRSS
jgi:hypothetical protein